jgi:hypothetical protein
MDHLLIQGQVISVICRMQDAEPCQTAGSVNVQPGAVGKFEDSLPRSLRVDQARKLTYFVELKSPHGRSAGLSNDAAVLAGAAPAPVVGLSAEVQKGGVVLHWTGVDQTPIRLHRKLLTVQGAEKTPSSPMSASASEAVLRDLLVGPEDGKETTLHEALDTTVRRGAAYEYTAQRVARMTVNGQTLELPGEVTDPVRVEVVDRFPPGVPTGLVAVAVADQKTIDLSWQSVTDDDLAGYAVYRRDEAGSAGEWKRISGPMPVVGPAYSDAGVIASHVYQYEVSSVDAAGRESKRSQEAQETAPSD